jgi:cysteine-rich repeat protein
MGLPRTILLALAFTGCIRSDLVTCDDGRACAVGLVCDELHQGCVTPEQATVCAGLAELATCMAVGVSDGVCHDGVCLSAGCGNGLIDPGEVCDDGNVQLDDGCSADCRSDETCGNGQLDLIRGERCDDGNRLGHDGCDSTCQTEQLAWSNISPPLPSIRLAASATYDDARQRVVAFGGFGPNGKVTGKTSEWDGRGWIDRSPLLSPAGRANAAIAYDPDHHVVVMFGGDDVQFRFGDTWLWDGSRWTEVTPDQSPPPRSGGALAYDAAHHVMILHGGLSESGSDLGDTWAWNGVTWTELTPASSPPLRGQHALAYDPSRGQMVMFGGAGKTDTWLWDGTTWVPTPAAAPFVPSPGSFTTLGYDRNLGALVLLDRYETSWWTWDGSAWQSRGAIPSAGGQGLVFDTVHNQTLVISSVQMEALDASTLTWSVVTPAPAPSLRGGATAAFDRRRGRLVLFGGEPGTSGTYYDETWEFDGSSWYRGSPAHVPPQRGFAELAYDADRGVTVMVGGDTSPFDTSTWEWDGTDWTEHPGTASGVELGAMAYDSKRHVVVRFGGYDTITAQPTNEIQTWNGSTWTTLAVSPRPPARESHAMTYDERRERIVMWGGALTTDTHTWEWDGSQWHDLAVSAPSGRNQHALVYDQRRGQIVMFGNGNADTWTYDGHWHQLVTPIAPPYRFAASTVYDSRSGEVVVFGGYVGAAQFLGDVWRLRWQGGSYDMCATDVDLDGDGLVGCADPDCYGVCDALCPPQTSCPNSRPRCGDGACDPVESRSMCPEDCGAAVVVCGDHLCGATETIASCPGDCTP